MTRPPPPIPAPLALIAEPFYRAAVAWRNRSFDAGRRVTNLKVPVISVGNISVGGTGKTPTVMRIVEWLKEGGRRPVIAMRGYRAAPGRMSDEETEYRTRFLDTPIVAQPDRLAGLRPILDDAQADCVVLDDGFQHRFIARDLDIVLIDATRSPFIDRCLPAGWLREPVSALKRAGVVILTHTEAATPSEISNLRSQIARLIPSTPILAARHAWAGLRGDAAADAPIDAIRERPVILASAIGNPDALERQVRTAGAEVIAHVQRRDHHEWSVDDLAEIRGHLNLAPAGVVLTTEKDWVKLSRLDLAGLKVLRPILSIDLGPDSEPLKQKVLTLHRSPNPPAS